MKLKKFNIYKIFVLMLVASATLFYACNQEEDLNIEKQSKIRTFNTGDYNVKVIDNNLLSFETREDYEQTINYLGTLGDENFEKWEKEIGFTNSMRKQYSKDVLVNEKMIEDDLLATMLNAESTIQIEHDLFKIDMVNEEVQVTPISEYKSASTKIYSTEDIILDLLDGITDNDEINAKKYCSSNKLGYLTWGSNGGSPVPANNDTYVKFKIVYQKAGIYRSLQAKIKQKTSGYGAPVIGVHTVNNYPDKTFYRHKKGCYNYVGGDWGNKHSHSIRPYSGTRRLKAYRLKVQFYISSGATNSYSEAYVELGCQKQKKCS